MASRLLPVVLGVLLASLALATPVERAAGTFVTDISKCPKLTKRTPTSVHDLRPDDFTVAMALGDSITAGAFAKGIQSNPLLNFAEWRGISYAGGGDAGAITIPNLFKYYNSALQGGSVGYNAVPELCFGPICPIGSIGWNPAVDKLNAAQSGALASNLLHEVRDYLAPMVKASGISTSAFKYLSIQIGSNDLCQLCLSSGGYGPGSADEFEGHMRATLEYVRLNIPNTVVNFLGVFKVSDIYPLTLDEEYCTQLIPFLPHVNLECSCALLSGPVGEATRGHMDSLMTQYNERIVKIVKEYQTAKYSNFAVIYQPANIPLADFPVEALSDVDCFHPHTRTHQRIAAGVWNRLTGDAATRGAPFAWEDTITFRCLEEGDRIKTSALL